MLKPRIGISACLLGQKVRHNGADKRNDWLVDILGKFVRWVPLCPEMEMGLGVPRKTMRLKGKPGDPRLIINGIENYRRGELPLIAPVTLLRHLVRSHGVDYVDGQLLFQPYPKELIVSAA